MVKHIQTILGLLLTDFLSVFDDFARLALTGLIIESKFGNGLYFLGQLFQKSDTLKFLVTANKNSSRRFIYIFHSVYF